MVGVDALQCREGFFSRRGSSAAYDHRERRAFHQVLAWSTSSRYDRESFEVLNGFGELADAEAAAKATPLQSALR